MVSDVSYRSYDSSLARSTRLRPHRTLVTGLVTVSLVNMHRPPIVTGNHPGPIFALVFVVVVVSKGNTATASAPSEECSVHARPRLRQKRLRRGVRPSMPRPCARRSVVIIIAVALTLLLNLHHILLARPLTNALVSSFAFAVLNRLLLVPLLSSLMRSHGVPVGGNRTEVFGTTPIGFALRVDVYEPPTSVGSSVLRPAALYFHAGAFNSLSRELCGGTLAWLATYGVVGFSASYRLTNDLDGAGLAGSIDDAWEVLRWLQTNAPRLRIDPKRIVVVGDSAGGGLALALSTGLRPGQPPAPLSQLPAAAIVGYAVTTFGATDFLTQRARGRAPRWSMTPATSELAVPNIFVREGRGPTAAASQATLRSTFAGANLYFGKSGPPWLGSLWPADGHYPVHDDARSVSPLSLAGRKRLPPMLLFSAAKDTVVPIGQQSRFCEIARRAGNKVSQIIFDEADHGEGGVYTAAGRQAALRFLAANGLLGKKRPSLPVEMAGVASVDAAQRALDIKVGDFPRSSGFRWWRHKQSTITLHPR